MRSPSSRSPARQRDRDRRGRALGPLLLLALGFAAIPLASGSTLAASEAGSAATAAGPAAASVAGHAAAPSPEAGHAVASEAGSAAAPDPSAPPALPPPERDAAATAIAAGQLPVLAQALRGRGVAEVDLVGVFAAAREAGLDPLELLRVLQAIAAAPGPSTRDLGTWLSGQLQSGLRGRALRRALQERLRGGAP